MTSHALITLTNSPHHQIFWSVLIKVLICAERSSAQLELGSEMAVETVVKFTGDGTRSYDLASSLPPLPALPPPTLWASLCGA